METPDINELNNSIHIKNEEFCKTKYPEFTGFLENKYPNITHIERLYMYIHPSCQPKCETCGGSVKFINFNKGYRKFCCPGCVSKNSNIKNKKINTCRLNYGVDNPSYSNDILIKKQTTMLERYGVDNTSKLKDNRKKAKQTMLERYGVDNVMKLNSVKEKIKSNNNKKYGVDWPLSLDVVKEKSNITYIQKYGGRGNASDIIRQKMKNTCYEKYGDLNFSNREKAKQTMLERYGELAYHHYCIPKDTNIEIFVQNILDKYNINYIKNNRSVLKGRELDIYIPSHKFAIEINGCHWHSVKFKPKKYHFEKFKECLNEDIQLLTIWDDQIVGNPKLIESIILSKLGIYNERIYARKCDVRYVSPGDSLKFLSENHIQGGVNSSVRLGLYYNDELISIMTFGKKRKSLNQKGQDGEWELYRFCNKINTQVIGGASKLLKYFIRNHKPTLVESFSSNDISMGNLYKTLSFKKNGESLSYWYVKDYKRYHRFNFTKKRLVGMGFDPSKTEQQIMSENRYECIYDSGQTKWILECK